MDFSLSTACAMLKNVYLGIQVIGCELRWLLGEDRTFHNQLRRLDAQHRDMQCRLSELTVLADPEKLALQENLTLLEADMETLAAQRLTRHKAHLAPVTRLFPEA